MTLKRVRIRRSRPTAAIVAFVQRETDLDANKGRTSIWLLPLGAAHSASRTG